jgi:hypothetical protein
VLGNRRASFGFLGNLCDEATAKARPKGDRIYFLASLVLRKNGLVAVNKSIPFCAFDPHALYAPHSSLLDATDSMFGFGRKKKIEDEMAQWLAHPLEFGVLPASTRFKRSYNVRVITHGDEQVHLVEYEMPDGTKGRGFVNGSLTWSFLGDAVNAIEDDDLLVAYYGWAWLFSGIQANTVATEFKSLTEEDEFFEKKVQEGFANVRFGARYKIGTSELFEYTATKDGIDYRGAGDTESDVCFATTDPKACLPSIYFLLGPMVIKERQD